MTPSNLDVVVRLLRSHFQEEAESGFPKLRRTPSSLLIRSLDYMDTLNTLGRDSLLDALAEQSVLRFFPPSSLPATAPLAAYLGAMRSQRFTSGLRYLDLRSRNAMRSDPVSAQMMADGRQDLPPELVLDPNHFTPAKAPLLRKLIEPAFAASFAKDKPRKLPGGETVYIGALDGVDVIVRIDFVARGAQLRYGVDIPNMKPLFVSRLTYEALWAADSGWDYLTEENAAVSIELLCDRIVHLTKLVKAAKDSLAA